MLTWEERVKRGSHCTLHGHELKSASINGPDDGTIVYNMGKITIYLTI